jgi:hypothetical protein
VTGRRGGPRRPLDRDQLVAQRRIERLEPDPDLAGHHLDRARTTVQQALLLTDTALQERLRYEAGLHLALAAMAHDGFRLRSGPGHHETAVAYLRAALGDSGPEVLAAVRTLDMARRHRNGELYRAVDVGSASAAASAAALDVLIDAIDDVVGDRGGHPGAEKDPS